LSNIQLPNTITSIENFAFVNCANFTEVIIPSGVKSLGGYAFANCSKLIKITFLGDCPSVIPIWSDNSEVFRASPNVVVYFTTNSLGWSSIFCGRPATPVGTIPISLNIVYNSTKCSVMITPSKIYFLPGENVTINASANPGYLFKSWSGDLISLSNTLNITMNSSLAIEANIVQDNQDSDGDGLTNYQESVMYNTNPNLKDSNGDGVEDGQAVSMGYSPNINFSALIAHPPTGLYSASQIQNMAMGDLVLNKNINGNFTLNFDIEQSADLQNWSLYQALSVPLNGLPTDKAFVRVKLKK
jgi:hypothetical protein